MFLSVFQAGFPTILRIYLKKKQGIIGSVRGTSMKSYAVLKQICAPTLDPMEEKRHRRTYDRFSTCEGLLVLFHNFAT